jgi:transposase
MKMTAVLESKDSVSGVVLYMALELSDKRWKLGFSNGERQRQVSIEAGDWMSLNEQIARAREKLGLAADCRIVSCYEAGRDGFWIHRSLVDQGIENVVLDSASIEVNRRQRRAKSDKVDVKALLRLLQRYWQGERGMLSVVRVPTVEEEDQRRLHRERERLLKERGSHSARIKSLLVAHGLRLRLGADFLHQLEVARGGLGYALGSDLKAELVREYERYRVVDEQIRGLEAEQKARAQAGLGDALEQVNRLMQLRSVGWQSSWVLVMEFFAWRAFRNQRQVAACAGLTPTPYSSGDSEREQGISKAGNRRVRTLMIELSWLWLRYQPGSALSQWFQRRFASGGKRMRRIGIVALARKLLIALWRYVTDGVIPEGAVLKAV